MRVGLWLAVLLVSSVAQADPYTAYTVNNQLGQPVLWSARENPVKACESIVGYVWQTAPPTFVRSSSLIPPSSCVVRTDTDTILVGTVIATPGVCPGSDVFDYGLQSCSAEVVGFKELYALIFTLGAFAIVLAGFALPWIQMRR